MLSSFENIVSAADKAYSDYNISLRCPAGFNEDVFGSIGKQVRMAKEARSHLYLRPNKDVGSEQQNVVNNMPLAENQESERHHIDDNHCSEHAEAVEPEHWSSPQYQPSHVDNKSQSDKVWDRPRINKIHTQQNAVIAGKQEVRQTSNEESSTVVSSQKPSKSKTRKDEQRSEKNDQNEHDRKLHVLRAEKKKKSGTNADVLQQLVVEKPTAEKVKVKSVVVKPPDKAQTGLADKNSSAHGDSCQRSSKDESAVHRSKNVLRSFNKVHRVPLLCIVVVQDIVLILLYTVYYMHYFCVL